MKKLFFLFLSCSFIFTGCSQASSTETASDNLKKVIYTEINTNSYEDILTLSGNAEPKETVKLSFKVSGILSQVNVNEGDYVNEGDIIASIDERDYNVQLDASKATKSGAETQVTSAQATADSAKAAVDTAQAGLNAAVSQRDTAQLQIDTEIPTTISQAKAQLDLTQENYDNIKKLYENGVATKNQMDEISAKLIVDQNTYQQALDAKAVAESSLNTAIAQVEASQAQLEAAKSQYSAALSQVETAKSQTNAANSSVKAASNSLSDTTITSPINGVILSKLFSTGETISAGYPIVVIGSADSMYVSVGVSDQYINKIQKGQTATIYSYGNDNTYTGVVEEISSLADTTTRTYTVKILVDNTDGGLKAGMICKTDINLASNNKILVPIESVIHLSEGDALYVLDEDIVVETPVEVGEIYGDKIQILSGVSDGDKVVIDGQFVVSDGERVIAEVSEND